jgi:hypothetical protein
MSFPYGSAIPSALGMVGGSVIDQRRFARHWALVEDLAYGVMSHQKSPRKIIHAARWNRYRELKHQGFMGEVEEALRLVARKRQLWEKVLAQKAMGTSVRVDCRQSLFRNPGVRAGSGAARRPSSMRLGGFNGGGTQPCFTITSAIHLL